MFNFPINWRLSLYFYSKKNDFALLDLCVHNLTNFCNIHLQEDNSSSRSSNAKAAPARIPLSVSSNATSSFLPNTRTSNWTPSWDLSTKASCECATSFWPTVSASPSRRLWSSTWPPTWALGSTSWLWPWWCGWPSSRCPSSTPWTDRWLTVVSLSFVAMSDACALGCGKGCRGSADDWRRSSRRLPHLRPQGLLRKWKRKQRLKPRKIYRRSLCTIRVTFFTVNNFC